MPWTNPFNFSGVLDIWKLVTSINCIPLMGSINSKATNINLWNKLMEASWVNCWKWKYKGFCETVVKPGITLGMNAMTTLINIYNCSYISIHKYLFLINLEIKYFLNGSEWIKKYYSSISEFLPKNNAFARENLRSYVFKTNIIIFETVNRIGEDVERRENISNIRGHKRDPATTRRFNGHSGMYAPIIRIKGKQ